MIVECPNCHFEQPLEGDFCPNCGKLIRPLLVSEKKKEIRQKRKTRALLFSMGTLLIIGCGLYFYFHSLNESQSPGAQLSLSPAEKIRLRKQSLSLQRQRDVKEEPVPLGESASELTRPEDTPNTSEKSLSAANLKPFSVSETDNSQEGSIENQEDSNTSSENSSDSSSDTSSNLVEVSHVFLLDLYNCELNEEQGASVPRKLNSESLLDFLDCGQILLEDRVLNNEVYIIEESPSFSLKTKLSAQNQQVRMTLNLERLDTDSLTSFSNQNSYSFQNIKKKEKPQAVSFRYSPTSVDENFYINALSNSAVSSVLFLPSSETKEAPSYVYIFVVFK